MADISFTLYPIFGDDDTAPKCTIQINDQKQNIKVIKKMSFRFDLAPMDNKLDLKFYGKSFKDSTQALGIESLSLAGYEDQKILQKSFYKPLYPQPWASQQESSGKKLAESIPACDYLGWNGTWTLDMPGAFFTWLHHTLDHGWIYKNNYISKNSKNHYES